MTVNVLYNYIAQVVLTSNVAQILNVVHATAPWCRATQYCLKFWNDVDGYVDFVV